LVNNVEMREVCLQVDSIARSFGAGKTLVQAVRGISFALRRGELTVLMGPSGSGKSTLLALISGLLRPTQGSCLIDGKDLWRCSERERRRFRLINYGFIFQHHFLFPALTARQQLEIVLRWGQGLKRKAAASRSEVILRSLGLENKAHCLPVELSGGEKQRVAIGRALVKSPKLVFADEPTSSLDWERGRQIVEILKEQTRANQTAVVLVTHDARVLELADRVIRLEDGRLASDSLSAAK
jgi:putative ABC transport system ATP-binding protein